MPVDCEKDLILVTAASGKQARGLLPHLNKTWKRVRLNVSSDASRKALQQQYPNAEVTTHDISDPRACHLLLDAVTACYLVTPGFHPQEIECGKNVINAALANANSGSPFQHLVHSSVIHPILRKMMNHDAKRYIEEYLVESGLPYTIVQPTHLMETLPLAKLLEMAHPSHPLFWDPSVPSTSVSTRDLGEAVAKIFAERERHFSATYELVGTRVPISYNEIANIISEEIGREVKIERKSTDEGVQAFIGMMTKGRPETASFLMKQAPARMFLYYSDRGIIGNPNVLEWLLGRKALDYRDWVKLCIEESSRNA